MKQPEKLYIVRKYIKAVSALEAIEKEKSFPVDDCWLDEDWKKDGARPLADAIGFEINHPQEEWNGEPTD